MMHKTLYNTSGGGGGEVRCSCLRHPWPTDYQWRQRLERWKRGVVLVETAEFCHFQIYL